MDPLGTLVLGFILGWFSGIAFAVIVIPRNLKRRLLHRRKRVSDYQEDCNHVDRGIGRAVNQKELQRLRRVEQAARELVDIFGARLTGAEVDKRWEALKAALEGE